MVGLGYTARVKGRTGGAGLRYPLFILFAVLISGAAWAAPVQMTASGVVALGPAAMVLEDPDGQLDIVDLLEREQGWGSLGSKGFGAGFSTSAWWLRVQIENPGLQSVRYFVDTGSSVADYIDVHVVRAEGHILSVHSGDRRPFSARPLGTSTVVVPLELDAGERVSIYLRLDSWDGLHEVVTPRLLNSSAWARQLQTEAAAHGLYYGTLLAILLYNLFLFLFIRERVFGLYLFYVGAFLFWSVVLRGYGLQYLWPTAPDFNNQILPIAAGLCYVSFGLFALEYLKIREQAPNWLYRAYWVSIGLNALAPMTALFGFYALAFAASVVPGVLMVFIAVTSGLMMVAGGSRPAKYFLSAFSLLAAGVVLYYLQLTGTIESGPISEYGIQVGSALEVLLLAFGLADQMNTLKSQKLKAERRARQAQLRMTTRLEQEVRQRTAELEEANLQLSDLATTDALTGALNRRRFNEILELEAGRHARQKTPLAFCMIDLDHFKAYNDRFGHQAGDELLRAVSHCLQRHLKRRGDYLFRIGGEEFALLLSANEPPAHTLKFVESLRLAIEALPQAHSDPEMPPMTASFGLLLRKAGSEALGAKQLYEQADALLYQAKFEGRNRVVHAIG